MTDISQGILSPSTYNVYDHGYKTGAQTNLFIGPIWVEEVVSIQLKSGTTDAPCYPYSSAYQSRLLLGKYSVAGSIMVSYTQPDYLLRILEMAAGVSMQDGELLNLIESRKSIFSNTVRSKLMTDKLVEQGNIDLSASYLTKYATDYVERISREIELMSYAGKRYQPRSFELTIITGNVYDKNQSIEIYEDVKIIGTGRVVANDDQVQVEMYDFMGRRKPERKQRIEIIPPVGYLSRENLLQMTKEIADGLIEAMVQLPTIKGIAPTHRTSLMVNTDRLAIAGLLNPNTRMYGKDASFIEANWSLEYPAAFSSYEDDGTTYNIQSQTKLTATVDGKDINTNINLMPPRRQSEDSDRQAFDNSYGRMVAVDRANTSKFISAVGPVIPQTIEYALGGTIALPRYRRNDFNIGSFVMPKITDVEGFSYQDQDLEALTMSTLWCSLVGFRGTAEPRNEQEGNADQVEPKTTYITEIAQPVNTFAYVDHVGAEWNEGGEFKLKISVPVYIDYVNTQIKGSQGKSTKKELEAGKRDTEVVLTFASAGVEPVITLEGDGAESISDKLKEEYTNLEYKVVFSEHDLPTVTGELEDMEPFFFEVSKAIETAELTTNFNKCVYLVPLLFSPNVEISNFQHISNSYHQASCAEEETPEGNSIPDDPYERLCYFLSTRNNKDESCDMNVAYDWTVKESSGYVNLGEALSFHGVLFASPKVERFRWSYTCPTCGQKIPLWDIAGVDSHLKLHVAWLIVIMPLRRDYPGQGADKNDDTFTYTHDLDTKDGRYAEIYNITRCDAQMYNLALLEEKGIGWETFVNALKAAFNVDIPTQQYLFPVKAKMSRIAFFLRGYGFKIDIDSIVKELLKCEFSDNVTTATKVKLPASATGWTLATALAVSVSGSDGSADVKSSTKAAAAAAAGGVGSDIYADVAGIVRNLVIEKLSRSGIRRDTENSGQGVIIAERDLITPAPNVVCYGLTEEGYEDLINATAPTTREGILEPIELGGYNG